MSSSVHVLHDYRQQPFEDLQLTGKNVLAGVYGNSATFAAPPIKQADFAKLVDNHQAAHDNQLVSSSATTKGLYQTAKDALIKGLDTVADYVDKLSGLTEAMVVLSGFPPSKTSRSGSEVPQTPTVDAQPSNNKGGNIAIACGSVKGASSYVAIVAEGAPLPDAAVFRDGQLLLPAGSTQNYRIDIRKSRKKSFSNLKKGVSYFFYFTALNAAGASLLSEGREVVCGS